ncbi:ABC transporter ATP-binding protein [Alkalibacter rhizosphaerae]|uniref:ABC transporter ATP-binding protein n=1 Tax=Alkalibacter rhizosphaerae TaxID=2815577 RepID=A0A974XJ92_9FIRM|nr:ABC transporter ATP-binding protein [Alkalibacter rhizosphaerae]QSX09408.1 ABC transporter ATP-binding protein [Alkalibacter rhizosphaerae]
MSNQQRTAGPGNQPPGIPSGGGRLGMTGPAEKPKDFKGTLRRLFAYILPYRNRLWIVLITSVFGTSFAIAGPKILGLATTTIFKGMPALGSGAAWTIDFSYIGRILWILAGLYLFSSLFSYLETYIMAKVAQDIVRDMRTDLNEKLGRLSLSYYDSHSHGDILSRVTNDMDMVGATLQQTLTQFITSVITIAGIVVLMLTISPWMTLITLVTLPLTFYTTSKIAKTAQKNFAAQQRDLGLLNGHVEEMYGGHVVVKSFGYEEKSIQQFQKINHRLYDSGWRSQFMATSLMPSIGFINNIGYILICVSGAIFVARGTIPIGDMQAFIQYSRQFTQPIIQSANIANVIQSTIAAAERVFEVLDEEEESPDPVWTKAPFQPTGRIAFDDVHFSYVKSEPLIADLKVTIQPGQTVAIVGPTGAGKTTLVNLLMRFYDIDQGTIYLDDTDIRSLPRGDLRSQFGMVLQDTWLFKGTIRENIAYGRMDAREEEIVAAATAARADHFIRTLPEGYDTVLNEDTSNISQGQKQLLTIARAVLADPKILILDEATSNVDTRTELLLQQAMQDLMKGQTSFVIAHRLSTIRNADMILVMDQGRIVETGTHDELLAREGFYHRLYRSQFEKNVS